MCLKSQQEPPTKATDEQVYVVVSQIRLSKDRLPLDKSLRGHRVLVTVA